MKKKLIFGLILTLIILITVGLFDLFSSRQTPNKRFVTEDSYIKSKDNQVSMTPQTLNQLRDLGVTETKELKLEYFFYTNNPEKAKNLSDEIKKLNYSVEYGKSAGDKKLFVITGWTIRMTMTDSITIDWTKQMCDLGYKYDCEFDGWGTKPDQE